MRKPTGRPRGRPLGSKQSAETREKLSQIVKARWQDPAFRAAQLPKLAEKTAIFVRNCAERRKNRPPPKPVGRPRVRPPKGTPEHQWYRKVAQALGVEAARALPIKSAETDRAGAP